MHVAHPRWHLMQKDKFSAEIAPLQFQELFENLLEVLGLYANIWYFHQPFWAVLLLSFVCRIYYWLPRLLQCLKQQQQQLTILNRSQKSATHAFHGILVFYTFGTLLGFFNTFSAPFWYLFWDTLNRRILCILCLKYFLHFLGHFFNTFLGHYKHILEKMVHMLCVKT